MINYGSLVQPEMVWERNDPPRGPSNNNEGEKISAHRRPSLSEFPFKNGLTEAELIRHVGGPNRFYGSGLIQARYDLNDGRELWLLFHGKGGTLSDASIIELTDVDLGIKKVVWEREFKDPPPMTQPK